MVQDVENLARFNHQMLCKASFAYPDHKEKIEKAKDECCRVLMLIRQDPLPAEVITSFRLMSSYIDEIDSITKNKGDLDLSREISFFLIDKMENALASKVAYDSSILAALIRELRSWVLAFLAAHSKDLVRKVGEVCGKKREALQ